MKKKVLALVCAAVLTMGMSLTAFAAPSASAGAVAGSGSANAGAVVGGSSSVKAEDVVKSSSSSSDYDEDLKTGAGQQFTSDTIAEFAKTNSIVAGPAGAKLSAVSENAAKEAIDVAKELVGKNAFIAAVFDLKADEAGEFTIKCPNVWAGQKVKVIHELSNGKWELITPSKVANNEVTFKLDSYSTVAIVVDTTSGKTGDVAGVVAAMAVVCLAGVAVCGKKKAAN